MKKIIISFIILLFFSSCMSTYRSYTIVVDYSRYAANGFFITESNSVSFEYMPVGSVIAHVSGSMKTSQGTRYVTAEDALAEFVYNVRK